MVRARACAASAGCVSHADEPAGARWEGALEEGPFLPQSWRLEAPTQRRGGDALARSKSAPVRSSILRSSSSATDDDDEAGSSSGSSSPPNSARNIRFGSAEVQLYVAHTRTGMKSIHTSPGLGRPSCAPQPPRSALLYALDQLHRDCAHDMESAPKVCAPLSRGDHGARIDASRSPLLAAKPSGSGGIRGGCLFVLDALLDVVFG